MTFAAAGSGEPRTVEPLPVDINVLAFADGVYYAGFDRGDIARVTSGITIDNGGVIEINRVYVP